MESPPRVDMHEPITVGERIADSAAALVGGWRFIIIQTVAVFVWVVLNIIAWDFKCGILTLSSF
jgi:uncharacterized membrane protein